MGRYYNVNVKWANPSPFSAPELVVFGPHEHRPSYDRPILVQRAHGDQTSSFKFDRMFIKHIQVVAGNFWTSVTPLQKRCRVPKTPLGIWEFLSNSDLNPGANGSTGSGLHSLGVSSVRANVLESRAHLAKRVCRRGIRRVEGEKTGGDPGESEKMARACIYIKIDQYSRSPHGGLLCPSTPLSFPPSS